MSDLDRAHHAIIDPLIEPDPSDETGLNTHFRSTFGPQEPLTPPGTAGLRKQQSSFHARQDSGSSKARSSVHIAGSPKVNPAGQVQQQHTGSSTDTNPYRRAKAASEAKNPFADPGEQSSSGRRRYDYPSPPNSASPAREAFPSLSPRREHASNYRAEVFEPLNEGRPRRSTHTSSSSPLAPSGRHRGKSLTERYPGDKSHRPLDTIRKDAKVANRAHHLRKQNFAGADIIDRLDMSGPDAPRYHHEGPYDAANISRNKNKKYSPIAAVRYSNEEALRATPREKITDALTKHRPLEGVAIVPSGVPDNLGRVLHYKEGTDLQREPGVDAYKRWPGMDYHPDDLKGMGEPSFSMTRALKDKKRRGESGTELPSRRRHSNIHNSPASIPSESLNGQSSGVGRRNTTSHNMGTSLRKRLSTLGLRKTDQAQA